MEVELSIDGKYWGHWESPRFALYFRRWNPNIKPISYAYFKRDFEKDTWIAVTSKLELILLFGVEE